MNQLRVVALAGGVGGAKLAHGLAQTLKPDELTLIVNTGDDMDYLGLRICPDIDTVCYTLAGLANPETGWGRQNESWTVMHNLVSLGGPSWFNLGDQDLGTHLERTRRLANGETLSQVIKVFCDKWGILHRVLPMTDAKVATWVNTREMGWLAFQEYFVRERCAPSVTGFAFRGVENAQPAPGVIEAIQNAHLIVVCPSNPWVSIDPILSISPIAEKLAEKPVVAMSPIIGGKTIKGPAAKMFFELGIDPSAEAVARHYISRLRGKIARPKESGNSSGLPFVYFIDEIDSNLKQSIASLGCEVIVTDTIMKSTEDRKRLGGEVVAAYKEKWGEGKMKS